MTDTVENSQNNQIFVHYKRRYVIVLLLGLYTATNYFQHFEYAVIADVISSYYHVEVDAVDWTALLFNIGCFVFLYPTMKCISKFRFHTSMVLATAANAFGASLKLLAIQNSYFIILLIGQIFPAFVALFPMSLPAILGANWFKSEHVATVIGINNAFTAFGCVVAFLFPVLIFNELQTESEVSNALFWIEVALAALTTLIFVLTVLFVREKPKTPPSFAEQSRSYSDTNHHSVKDVARNKNYIFLLIIFSLVMSTSQVTTIVLNQAIKAQFDRSKANQILTIAGILSIMSGVPASFATGVLCKRCKQYKLLLITSCILLIIFLSLYTFGLYALNVAMIYAFIFLSGFICNGQMVLIMDYIVEVTYPYSESTTLNIATCVGSIPGLALVPAATILIRWIGAARANLLIVFVAIVNFIFSLFVANDLRRQRVNDESAQLIVKNKRPIILQHGLFSSGIDWIINSPGLGTEASTTIIRNLTVSNNLGFALSLFGYDVWLTNSRGNAYGINHTALDPHKGTSSWNLVHYGQGIQSKMFRKFDYGSKNKEKYGQETPPPYDLKNIKSKYIAILHSRNDWLATPKDVNFLRKEIRG
ncbi:feline leukemia virus subgroup C receptor-related protein 2-like protein, partial [Dinothrombium tinctorium]